MPTRTVTGCCGSIRQRRSQRELNPGHVGDQAELEHRIERGRDVIHATDADVHARCGNGRREPDRPATSSMITSPGAAGWRASIVDQRVGVALIVRGLDHGRLRIHVKQDGRDGIAIR